MILAVAHNFARLPCMSASSLSLNMVDFVGQVLFSTIKMLIQIYRSRLHSRREGISDFTSPVQSCAQKNACHEARQKPYAFA